MEGATTVDPDGSNFRRVKPLPKRRRTAALNTLNGLRTEYESGQVASFNFQDPQALAALADLHARPYLSQLGGPHALKDFFNHEHPLTNTDPRLSYDIPTIFGPPPSAPVVPVVQLQDDEDQAESDYVDHLQLPANTKKRKIPGLNRPSSLSGEVAAGGEAPAAELEGQMNEGSLQLAAHRLLVDGPDDGTQPVTQPGPRKNTRESNVTQAGMRQKSLVNTRKKQFAAVLDDFPDGDSLALEQALSARYPQLDGLDPKAAPPLRTSRKANLKSPQTPFQPTLENGNVPTCDFTFEYPSASAERSKSTREEAARLQSRFEEELARQAAKAAEAAARHAAMVDQSPKNRKRAPGANSGIPTLRLDSDSMSGDQGLLKGRQKKKKRSALANASNPHHLRNYVPSRLPQQPPPLTQASLNAANLLSPPPLRFLTAQIPQRRRKKGSLAGGMPVLTHPMDEWICANCEYNLFYGDEGAFRRGIKNRKKILTRRRRARERAAAAASGAAQAAPDRPAVPSEYSESEMVSKNPPANPLQTGGKRERQYAGVDSSDTLK